MPNFVLVSSDAADRRFFQTAGSIQNSQSSATPEIRDRAAIRRPHRGIQVKEDTYATLSVFDSRGRSIDLISESSRTPETDQAGSGRVTHYADFILQQVTDQRMEKQQVIETFGDSFIFFFGERPRIVTFQGILMNTEDFNWRSQFMANYEQFFRGTRLVQRNARAFLSYDTLVVEGYPINVTATESSSSRHIVNFQMSMFMTNYSDFSNVGDPDFPFDVDSDVAVLNAELEQRQLELEETSIPAQVRFQNLVAGSGSITSLGDMLREVTKVTDSIFNFVDAVRQGAYSLLTGRVVSTPLGQAGFLSQIGDDVSFAAGSISTATINLAESRGIAQLRVPRPTQFVHHAITRGRKSDNIDEYPLLEDRTIQVPSDLARELEWRRFEAQLSREARDAKLVALNLQAAGQQDILQGIADVIRLSQKGFTMIATARNVIRAGTVGSVVQDALGFSGIHAGQVRFTDPFATDEPPLPPDQERFRDPAFAGVVQDPNGFAFLRNIGG